jgi:hypothetical protein
MTRYLVSPNVIPAAGALAASNPFILGQGTDEFVQSNLGNLATFLWKNIGFYKVLGSSGVAASFTAGSTSEAVLATVNVPAGAMGANGALRVTSVWSFTNSANSKNIRVRLGGLTGTTFQGPTITGAAGVRMQCGIFNRNSQSVQVGYVNNNAGFGTTAAAIVTGAIDTSLAQDLVLTQQIGTVGETITLESYAVEIFYKA